MATSCVPRLPRSLSVESSLSLAAMNVGGSNGFSFDTPVRALPSTAVGDDVERGFTLPMSTGMSLGQMSLGSLSEFPPADTFPNAQSIGHSVGSLGNASFGRLLREIGANPLASAPPAPPVKTRLLNTASGSSVLSMSNLGPFHWLDEPRQSAALDGYCTDDDDASRLPKHVLPVVLSSPPPSMSPASSPTSAAPLKRRRDEFESAQRAASSYQLSVLPVAPPGGAPSLAAASSAQHRPLKAMRRDYRSLSVASEASAASSASARSAVVAAPAAPTRAATLPPPPTFFDPAADMDDKTYNNLHKRVLALVHGPPDRKLGKYYGADDWCCERCRNIFKDHTKPFKRPAHDVRSVLRKLRLQACVDVGMRGYATGESRCTLSCCSRSDARDSGNGASADTHAPSADTSGNFNNHNSKNTPLARDHECAAGRRTLELLWQIRGGLPTGERPQ